MEHFCPDTVACEISGQVVNTQGMDLLAICAIEEGDSYRLYTRAKELGGRGY